MTNSTKATTTSPDAVTSPRFTASPHVRCSRRPTTSTLPSGRLLIRSDRSVRRRLGRCPLVHRGDFRRRGAQPSLDVCQAVADDGELLSQVGMALLELF